MWKSLIAVGTAGVLLSVGGVPANALDATQYNVTIKVVGPDGRAAGAELVLAPLDSVSDPETFMVENGSITVRRAKGQYLLDTQVVTSSGDIYRVLQPGLEVGGNTTVVADTRLAKPVTITVPRKAARPKSLNFDYLAAFDGSGFGNTINVETGQRLFTAQVGPIPAKMTISTQISSNWAVPGPKNDYADTPFMYNLCSHLSGPFPTGYRRAVREAQLVKIVAQHTRTSDRPLIKTISCGDSKLGGATDEFRFRGAGTVTQWMDPVSWDTNLQELEGDRGADLDNFEQPPADGKRWNAAPFYPTWRSYGRASRRGDQMILDLVTYSDQDGHEGDSPLDTRSMKLYRDGKLLVSADDLGLQTEGLPAAVSNYRLVANYSRPSWSPLSARTSVVWTFRSGSVVPETELPLQTVRFRPQVDAANLVRRGPVTVLPFQADSRAGVPAAKSAKLQYSGDDGKTWRQAVVLRKANGTFVAVFPTPKGSYVSLRAQLTGPVANTVDQTLIRAYQLK